MANNIIVFVDVRDKEAFADLLKKFFSYTSREIQEYNASQKLFFQQIPELIKRIRETFDKARKDSKYKKNIAEFEKLLKETINPDISRFETREIIVQHFLTIDIFSSVFSEISFEKYNPIARELENITRNIFNQGIEKHLLKKHPSIFRCGQKNGRQHPRFWNQKTIFNQLL